MSSAPDEACEMRGHVHAVKCGGMFTRPMPGGALPESHACLAVLVHAWHVPESLYAATAKASQIGAPRRQDLPHLVVTLRFGLLFFRLMASIKALAAARRYSRSGERQKVSE